jgi:uncharacterized membrane protein YcfT
MTTLAAAIAPLILGYWIIAKIGFGRFLFERPAWAHIDRPRRGQPVSIAPAE